MNVCVVFAVVYTPPDVSSSSPAVSTAFTKMLNFFPFIHVGEDTCVMPGAGFGTPNWIVTGFSLPSTTDPLYAAFVEKVISDRFPTDAVAVVNQMPGDAALTHDPVLYAPYAPGALHDDPVQ
jgi:hypothetical protein